MSEIEGSIFNLRLVMVVEDFSATAGGIPAVVYDLSGRMAAQGIETHVVTGSHNPMVPPKGVNLHHFAPTRIGTKWSYSKALSPALRKLTLGPKRTVFHIHGVWSGPQFIASQIAIRNQIPNVVSSHGMLEPWLWNNQNFAKWIKKRMYWQLVARSIYKHATVVHAITGLEKQNILKLINNRNISVIPNAVYVPRQPTPVISQREHVIFFLGRLDPKKGIDFLIESFGNAIIDDHWRLVIAGTSRDSGYESRLRRLAEKFPQKRITFLGAIHGSEKDSWLRRAWVLAAPSHSEVIGLVNLEAAVAGLPSITTHQTGLTHWAESGALLIEPDKRELRSALESVCQWNEQERSIRATQLFNYVAQNFNWDLIVERWTALYRSLSA